MTDLNKPVSRREFAKMVGQSEGAVRKAILRNSIKKGITEDGKIIPSVASSEWGKAILKSYINIPVVEKKVVVKKIVVAKPPPLKPNPVKKEKKEAETYDEVVAEIMTAPLPKVTQEDLDNEPLTELSDKDDKVEAERRASITKARILELSYLEKKGQLIDRSKIAKVLFGYGQEIRVSFEGLTNISLDKIRASKSRHEAKRIMDEEIHKILNEVSKITTRKV